MTQSEPKFIAKRIEVLREKKKLTITIHQRIERWQEALLIAWFSAWSFCGAVFLFYLISTPHSSDKVLFGICVGVWMYFFVRIGKVILWRFGGKEIVVIAPGELSIKNAFWNRGRTQIFLARNIFKLGVIKRSSTSFLSFLDQSFWVLGGERVGFSYGGKKMQFGKQLSENDAVKLAKMVDHAMNEIGKEAR